MKRCSRCKHDKPEAEFPRRKGTPDGRDYACKVCKYEYMRKWFKANAEKNRKNGREYYWKNRDAIRVKSRGVRLKHKYGLTIEQHKAMYVAQNGCCAICQEPVPYAEIHTDHDHDTGRVRGLLCRKCNRDIAIFDHGELFSRAIEYVERSLQ